MYTASQIPGGGSRQSGGELWERKGTVPAHSDRHIREEGGGGTPPPRTKLMEMAKKG